MNIIFVAMINNSVYTNVHNIKQLYVSPLKYTIHKENDSMNICIMVWTLISRTGLHQFATTVISFPSVAKIAKIMQNWPYRIQRHFDTCAHRSSKYTPWKYV